MRSLTDQYSEYDAQVLKNAIKRWDSIHPGDLVKLKSFLGSGASITLSSTPERLFELENVQRKIRLTCSDTCLVVGRKYMMLLILINNEYGWVHSELVTQVIKQTDE